MPYLVRITIEGKGGCVPRHSLVLTNPTDAVVISEGIGHDAIIDAVAGTDDDCNGVGCALGVTNCRGDEGCLANAGKTLCRDQAVTRAPESNGEHLARHEQRGSEMVRFELVSVGGSKSCMRFVNAAAVEHRV